jgi:hypothetical protein
MGPVDLKAAYAGSATPSGVAYRVALSIGSKQT